MPATEHYPWTDVQIDYAFEAGNRHLCEFDRDDIRELLRGFREAGITIKIPSPRFMARDRGLTGGSHWEVVDTAEREPEFWVARFHGRHADQYAREHAERLNASEPLQETP